MASTAARNNLTQVSPRTAVAGTPRTRRPTCQGHTAARATSPRSRTTHKYQAAGPARSAPPRRRSRAATRLCAAAAPRPVWKSKIYGAFVLNHRVTLHAIDATPARRRGDVGSSPLDGASAATSSPRNDLVKNYRVHPTHWLTSTQAATSARDVEARATQAFSAFSAVPCSTAS